MIQHPVHTVALRSANLVKSLPAMVLAPLLVTFLLAAPTSARAQKATEMFIPIGQSPGLSAKKYTLIGRVQALNAAERSMTVADPAGATTTVRPGPQTSMWLDRSKLKKPNRYGNYTDVRTGMTVEVKFRNNDRAGGVAEWIKLEATE